MKNEIKELRGQLMKYEAISGKNREYSLSQGCEASSRLCTLFSYARAKIRSSQVAIEDQRYLLENLSRLIASGRLDARSFAFQKICTIVRSKLSQEELH